MLTLNLDLLAKRITPFKANHSGSLKTPTHRILFWWPILIFYSDTSTTQSRSIEPSKIKYQIFKSGRHENMIEFKIFEKEHRKETWHLPRQAMAGGHSG